VLDIQENERVKEADSYRELPPVPDRVQVCPDIVKNTCSYTQVLRRNNPWLYFCHYLKLEKKIIAVLFLISGQLLTDNHSTGARNVEMCT
jgi:hypothetical protein